MSGQWFSDEARRRARAEAAERYCLADWWSGHLGHLPVKVKDLPAEGLEITNPLTRDRVVILWRQIETGHRAYGYAAGANLRQASWRALVELERSAVALDRFHQQHPAFSASDLPQLFNKLERRVVYYSLPEGQQAFDARLQRNPSSRSPDRPAPVFDCEVRGPWSRYATVWRVIYPTESREHFAPSALTFFW